MQRLEVSGAVRPLRGSLGVKWLKINIKKYSVYWIMIINLIGKTYSTNGVSRYEVVFRDIFTTLDTLGSFTMNIITTDQHVTITNGCLQCVFKTEIFRKLRFHSQVRKWNCLGYNLSARSFCNISRKRTWVIFSLKNCINYFGIRPTILYMLGDQFLLMELLIT